LRASDLLKRRPEFWQIAKNPADSGIARQLGHLCIFEAAAPLLKNISRIALRDGCGNSYGKAAACVLQVETAGKLWNSWLGTRSGLNAERSRAFVSRLMLFTSRHSLGCARKHESTTAYGPAHALPV
jgi:hypothetical protein